MIDPYRPDFVAVVQHVTTEELPYIAAALEEIRRRPDSRVDFVGLQYTKLMLADNRRSAQPIERTLAIKALIAAALALYVHEEGTLAEEGA